jgi:hypothetical protein
MWPFSRNASVDDVNVILFHLRQMNQRFERFTTNMARTFEDVLEDLDTLTTSAADRINAQNALIAQLTDAVAAGDQRTAEALAAQVSEHVAAMEAVADRLRDVAIDANDVVPDTSPLPEVPEAPVDVPAEDAPAGDTPPAESPDVPVQEDAGTIEEDQSSADDDETLAQDRNL